MFGDVGVVEDVFALRFVGMYRDEESSDASVRVVGS